VRLTLTDARIEDAAVIAAIRSRAADALTTEFGLGHWSAPATEKGVLFSMRYARVFLAKRAGRVVGTLRLANKKPWAIDPEYFTPVKRAIYLTDMAVDPGVQRTGVGRALLDHALAVALGWPANSIRLDAYDAPAGAGDFYAKCGYREVGRVVYRKTPLVYYEKLIDR
jgi:GNAT superfamily N-acetyltransferase